LNATGAARGLSVDDEIYAVARGKGQAPTEAGGEPQTRLVAQADREPVADGPCTLSSRTSSAALSRRGGGRRGMSARCAVLA